MSLIAVMWIITILTVLASEFMYSMQLEMRIARNWRDQVSAYYAAKGGIENAIVILKEDELMTAEVGYDALDEDWAQELTGELGELNNEIYQSTYQTVVTDESAKINVNTIDEETLAKVIVYCMGSSDEMMEDEVTLEAQTLAAAIIESRPYRTAAEMAKATDMTPELLYGEDAVTSGNIEDDEESEGAQSTPLVDITTVYSAERNVTSDGGDRANINGGDANQIQQRINPEGQEIITEQEAQAIVDYGNEQGNNQQGGGQPGQGGQPNQAGGQPNQAGGQADPTEAGGQANQEGYTGIGQLLDVPAISQQTFDSISNSITVDSGDDNRDDNNNIININTADENQLESLDGIDSGIAASIVSYRNQQQFGNTDEIREVKLISIQDMRNIIDRVAISDDELSEGKVNINTAPLEILTMLPGMDEEKAQAIVDYRTVAEGQTSMVTSSQQGGQEAGPFTSTGQLMDVQGMDENTFRGLIDHISCRSAVFMIESEGRSLDEKIVQTCTIVIDRSGDRIKTKYWKQE
ncbi:helix-hairpin-helix domain-containing protein [Candidatus Poribacteria bacterium]